MFRSVVILIIDVLFAIPKVSFMLAVYFWTRVFSASDPELARRRAIRWTWITVLAGAAIVALWVVLANLVQW